MKKNILLATLLCINTSIYANSDESLEKLKEEAFISYKQNNFETAYNQLSKLYMSKLGDAKINFLLGRAAFETQRYEIALAAFERVRLLEPQNSRNDLELARTQFKLEMYEDAKLSFEKVLKNPNLPKTVKTNIEIYLTKTNEKLKKSFYTLYAKAGIIYDSNVNFAPINDVVNLQGVNFNMPSQRGNTAEEFQGVFTHMHDVGEKNGLELRNQVSFYHRENNDKDLKDYNITYASYIPGLVYKRLYTTYELNAILDRVWLDGVEYLDGVSLVPSISHKLDSTNIINASYKIMDKTFKRTGEEDKDSKYYEGNLGYQKILSDSYLTLNALFSKEIKDGGTRLDIDQKAYGFNGSYSKQFYPTYIGKFDFSYKKKMYEDYSAIFDNKRNDKLYQATFSLSKKFTSSLFLDGKISYEKNNSNQASYTYDKKVFGLYINAIF